MLKEKDKNRNYTEDKKSLFFQNSRIAGRRKEGEEPISRLLGILYWTKVSKQEAQDIGWKAMANVGSKTTQAGPTEPNSLLLWPEKYQRDHPIPVEGQRLLLKGLPIC